jgi:hypothetical protein
MANEKRLIDANALEEKILSLTLTVTGLRYGKGVLLELLNKYRNGILQAIKEQPTVDAVPVVHGHWIHHWGHDECSECGQKWSYLGGGNYCPNCGADMRSNEDG